MSNFTSPFMARSPLAELKAMKVKKDKPAKPVAPVVPIPSNVASFEGSGRSKVTRSGDETYKN